MGKLTALALAAAFYPTLLAIVILILTRPHPVRLLTAFYVGAMITSFTVGLAILFALEGSGAIDSSPHGVSPTIDLVAGILCLLVALGLARRYDRRLAERRRARKPDSAEEEARDPWTARMLGRDSLSIAFGLGIVLDLPSVWYLAALKQIDAGDHGVAADVLLVLAFNLVMFLLVEIPLAYYLLAPERAQALVGRIDSALKTHARQLGIAVAAIVGAYLFVDGLTGLLS
jgi:hypothetical protein